MKSASLAELVDERNLAGRNRGEGPKPPAGERRARSVEAEGADHARLEQHLGEQLRQRRLSVELLQPM